MPFDTNPKPSLTQTAYKQIENLIVTHRLKPGAIFTESELAASLKMGRTPVREALQRLAYQGLVSTMPRRGMMVSDINIANHLTLLETRRVLEKLLVQRAARRASREQRDALANYAMQMREAAGQNDVAAYIKIDYEFTTVVEQASGNPFAVSANAVLHTHCRRFWYHYQKEADLPANANLHIAIIDAVIKGDEQAAARAVDKLLDHLVEFSKNAVLQS